MAFAFSFEVAYKISSFVDIALLAFLACLVVLVDLLAFLAYLVNLLAFRVTLVDHLAFQVILEHHRVHLTLQVINEDMKAVHKVEVILGDITITITHLVVIMRTLLP